MAKRPKVLIFGGGVGGLTAAHELIERDFDVTVFEARHWGGKIRSMGKPGTGTDGRKDLPGEHGFHFFPTFYRHIPDTMQRIPFGSRVVFDNLIMGNQELVARTDGPHAVIPSHIPRHINTVVAFFRALHASLTGIPAAEFEVFLYRALKFMTACDERRIAEFDNISWWDYIEAERMSPAYQQLLASLPATLLIAIHPTLASARTMGNAFIDMLNAGFNWTGNIERSLAGPPSDMWVDPWVKYVSSRATMRSGYELLGFDFDPQTRRIRGANVRHEGIEETVQGDYYICAVPVEVAAPLITKEMRDASPSLAGISDLCVSWMNGLQYFLDRPMPIVNGHIAFEDSAWALTSVSQHQFWQTGINFGDYGNGQFREVVSVIISDWDTAGTEVVKKPARACTPDELFAETLAQMNAALSRRLSSPDEGVNIEPIPRAAILDWFLDPDIQFFLEQAAKTAALSAAPPAADFNEPEQPPAKPHRSRLYSAQEFSAAFRDVQPAAQPPDMMAASVAESSSGQNRNAEPLYITTVGAWQARPEATTAIHNFFLASDYVRTVADFASAEGANEAARKAVNGVLAAAGSSAARVKIWPRDEIDTFIPFQLLDRYRFEHGKPQSELPKAVRELMRRVLAGMM